MTTNHAFEERSTESAHGPGDPTADPVIQIRIVGTRSTLPLPAGTQPTIGRSSACSLELTDPKVSRLHATVTDREGRWTLDDVSHNGTTVAGAVAVHAMLRPGDEIKMGATVMVAESPGIIAIRNYVERLVGYDDDALGYVDVVMKAIQTARRRLAPLVLAGDEDMVPIASELHRRMFGNAPFIVCDPRRRTGPETTRSQASDARGMFALAAASGGTLAIRAERPPVEMCDVLGALSGPDAPAMLVLCAGAVYPFPWGIPIVIPAVTGRPRDLDRVITEYENEARACLDAAGHDPGEATAEHHSCAMARATSHSELAKLTLRLAALRCAGNVGGAAALLGMARVSLERWLRHAGLHPASPLLP